jgi:hypothetical protein
MNKKINFLSFVSVLTIVILFGCANPERPKVLLNIEKFGKSVDAIQLTFDTFKDSIPENIIKKTKEIEKNLRDSTSKFSQEMADAIKSAKFNESDEKEVVSKMNEIKLRGNELMKKVLNKKTEAFIKTLEKSKADLIGDLKKNQFPALADMQKTTLIDLDNTINKLKLKLKEQLDSLKKVENELRQVN